MVVGGRGTYRSGYGAVVDRGSVIKRRMGPWFASTWSNSSIKGFDFSWKVLQ